MPSRLSRSLAFAHAVAFFAMTAPVFAEVLRLKDGTSLEGTVKRNPEGYDVTDAAGTVTHIDADKVKGIELSSKSAGPAEAESRLASLRRSVENIGDIKSIIDRYDRFIEQNKQSPIAKEAEHDVATWRERQEKGMVKVGNRWVSPEEKQQIIEQGVTLASDARELLRAGRARAADDMLQQILTDDPTNIPASYLRALILYKQDQSQPARKLFDVVLVSIKDHAPTLNNVAVICWRQNQQPGALTFYTQAMQASPMNREVLNNVAEALNALPPNQKGTVVAQRCIKLFIEQDTALQQLMAQQGWYRWGSTWVDKAQMQELQVIEKEIQKRLDEMSGDYEDLKKKIGKVDDDVDDNLRRMKVIEDSSYARDAQGNLVRISLPRRYYDLADDNKKLARDRAEIVRQGEDLRASARLVQQKIPTPRFTSVQRMIGVDGAPLLAPPKAPGPGGVPLDAGNRSDLAPPKIESITPDTRPTTRPASIRPLTPSAETPGVRSATTKPALNGKAAPPSKLPDSLLGS